MEKMFYILQMIGKHFSHAILEAVDTSIWHNRKALVIQVCFVVVI